MEQGPEADGRATWCSLPGSPAPAPPPGQRLLPLFPSEPGVPGLAPSCDLGDAFLPFRPHGSPRPQRLPHLPPLSATLQSPRGQVLSLSRPHVTPCASARGRCSRDKRIRMALKRKWGSRFFWEGNFLKLYSLTFKRLMFYKHGRHQTVSKPVPFGSQLLKIKELLQDSPAMLLRFWNAAWCGALGEGGPAGRAGSRRAVVLTSSRAASRTRSCNATAMSANSGRPCLQPRGHRLVSTDLVFTVMR